MKVENGKKNDICYDWPRGGLEMCVCRNIFRVNCTNNFVQIFRCQCKTVK